MAIRNISARQRQKGRRSYLWFNFANSISYNLLAETVIVLFVLQLGGNTTWAGAVSAVIYLALPAMWLGQLVAPHLGLAKTAAGFWVLRCMFALFMVCAPWIAVWGQNWALWSVLLGVIGFVVARAAGMVCFPGLVNEISTVRDRGDLIAGAFRLNQLNGMWVTVCLALFLGPLAQLWRYQVFLSIGIVCGLVAAGHLSRIPESGRVRQRRPFHLFQELGWIWSDVGRRWFFLMSSTIPPTRALSRLLPLLLAKQAYGLPDQQVLLLVLCSTLGGILASYTYSVFLDQLGSRPMLVLTGFVDLFSAGMVLAMPSIVGASMLGSSMVDSSIVGSSITGVSTLTWGALLSLLGFWFLLNGYTFTAFDAAMQHYFISIVEPERQLNQGIVTQSAGGLFAGIGLWVASWALEWLPQQFPPALLLAKPLLPFRWLYAGLMLFIALRMVALYRLPALSSQNVRDALNAIFSPWDWRAVHAVKRALQRQNEEEELRAIETMRPPLTPIFRRDLHQYLASPSFFVRRRALNTLISTRPEGAVIPLLLQDMRENTFATAHFSAQLLGEWRVHAAKEELAAHLHSEDLLLRSHCIGALVNLNAREHFGQVQDVFAQSTHPRVLIEGGRAISLWGNPQHYPLLLAKYHLNIPPQTKDELSLSVTRLLHVHESFYRGLSLLRGEGDALWAEWEEDFGARDRQGLCAALQDGAPRRSLLEQSLHLREAEFQPWFVRETAAFLSLRPEHVWAEMAFMMTFLLIGPPGLHWLQATQRPLP